MRFALSLLFLVVLAGCQPGQPEPTPKLTPPPEPRLKVSSEMQHLYEGLDAYLAAFPREDYEVVENGDFKYHVEATSGALNDALRKGEAWEPLMQEQFKSLVHPGDVVVELGARNGVHTTLLNTLVGEKGRVYAWEPRKKLYRELVQNLKLNGCNRTTCLRTAIGDSEGVIDIGPIDGGMKDSVELRTLDSYDFPRIDLVKIDAASLERSVIEGATETLLRNRPIVLLEIGKGRNAYTRGLLAALGYRSKPLGSGHDMALPFRSGTERLKLDLGTSDTRSYLGRNFYYDEYDERGRCTYVWTRGPTSILKVPLAEVKPEPYLVGFRALAFSPLAPLEVEVRVNGRLSGRLSLGERWGAFELPVSAESLKIGENLIELSSVRQASPADFDPNNQDTRSLSVGLDLLWLAPEVLEP